MDDVLKVEGILPEDDHYDHLKHQRDVAHQASEAAQFVLSTTIFFVFFRGARVDQEKLQEVVHPGADDKKDEASESLSRDGCRELKHV